MTRSLLVGLLTLPLVMVGCIGGALEADDAGADDPLDSTSVAPDPTTIEARASPVVAVEAVAGPVPIVVPITWDGALGTYVYVCEHETIQECAGHEASPSTHMFVPALPGLPIAGSVILTWEASSPLTEELSFGAMVMPAQMAEDQEHPMWWARGMSPLQLDISGITMMPGDEFHFMVFSASKTPAPVFVFASHEQPFHMEGTMTVMPGEVAAGMDHSAHGG